MLPRLDDRHPAPDGILLAGKRGAPGRAVRRHRVMADALVADRVQPGPKQAHPAGVYAAGPVTRDDIDGPGDVIPGQSMNDRLFYRPPALMPFAGAPVQDGHEVGLGRELAQQHLAEQLVVTKPLPVVVQGYQKQVLALENVDYLCRVGRADHRVAQRWREPVQDGGPAQEIPDLAGLAAEDLLSQEIAHEAVITGELPDEGARARVTAKRERGKVYPGRPPLGPLDKVSQIGWVELHGRDAAHERGRLRRHEAQLGYPDLEQIADRPQPPERQRWIYPGDQDDLSHGRKVQQEELQLVMAVAVADQVIVIKHQGHRRSELGELVDQGRQHRSPQVWPLPLQLPQQVPDAELRASPLQRSHDVPAQPCGVVVTRVD